MRCAFWARHRVSFERGIEKHKNRGNKSWTHRRLALLLSFESLMNVYEENFTKRYKMNNCCNKFFPLSIFYGMLYKEEVEKNDGSRVCGLR